MEKIRDGDEGVINAVWENFPEGSEIDLGDDDAVRRMLRAINTASIQAALVG